MRFSETLRGVIILGFGFGPPCCIIWFLFERLEVLLKEGYNPTIQLTTLFLNKNLDDSIIIKPVYDYIASTKIFQWDTTQSILSWGNSIEDFIMQLPIELWFLASWPILNWIGFRLSKFMRKI